MGAPTLQSGLPGASCGAQGDRGAARAASRLDSGVPVPESRSLSSALVPRIHDRDPSRLEVADVARRDAHSVDQCDRCDLSVLDVEPSASAFRGCGHVPVPLGGAFIEREDPAAELRAGRLPEVQQLDRRRPSGRRAIPYRSSARAMAGSPSAGSLASSHAITRDSGVDFVSSDRTLVSTRITRVLPAPAAVCALG